jgi:hypothetical protein
LSAVCDRLVVSPGTSVSSTNKTDRHDITEILLKVVLNTINKTKRTYIIQNFYLRYMYFCIFKDNNCTDPNVEYDDSTPYCYIVIAFWDIKFRCVNFFRVLFVINS